MSKENFTIKLLVIISAILLLSGCAGMRPPIAIPKQQPSAVKISKRPRVALVLGSGGARGYAHLGVLEVLHKAGIPIDMVAGASIGSFVAALYADSLNPDRVADIMFRAGFWDYADVTNLPNLQGPIQGYHIQKYLLKNMRARQFSQLKISLMVATTDFVAGKIYPIVSGPVAPAVEASAAIPGAVQPVHMYGHVLVDGGMVDPVPVDLVKKYHPRVIIAVNVGKELPKDLPINAFGIYKRGYLILWKRIEELSAKGADVIIHPHVGDVGTFDLSKKRELYYAGVKAAQKALPKIKKILRQKHIKY